MATTQNKDNAVKPEEEQVDMNAVLAKMNARMDDQDKSIKELKESNDKLKKENADLKKLKSENASLQAEVKTLQTSVANINPENLMSEEALQKIFEAKREERIAAIKQPGVHGLKIYTAAGKDLDPKNLPNEDSGIVA